MTFDSDALQYFRQHKEVLMARVSKEQILENIGDLWMIEVRESERGWGSETTQELYTILEEAKQRYDEINQSNPTDHVPDYYIVASEPRKVTIRLF